MRFLVLGGAGQVGTELRAMAVPRGVEIVAPPRSIIDLEDHQAITKIVATGPWSAVINAAGYTNVDRAESEEVVAFAVNAKAVCCIATETGRRGIPFIHISTDYVFDGRKGAPYVECDATAPLNVYGRSKLAGEVGVCDANPRHIVLRTAWVHSPYGKNFVKTILQLAQERDRLTIVADQVGCPTAARDIAQVCLDLAIFCADKPERAAYGIYHFAGGGQASWHEFATAIVELSAGRLGRSPKVIPIQTADYPTPAVRPADGRLDCTAIEAEFGITPRPWRGALAETIARLLTYKDKP
jgi:dTDP-4-dehydrorhamnose reductase